MSGIYIAKAVSPRYLPFVIEKLLDFRNPREERFNQCRLLRPECWHSRLKGFGLVTSQVPCRLQESTKNHGVEASGGCFLISHSPRKDITPTLQITSATIVSNRDCSHIPESMGVEKDWRPRRTVVVSLWDPLGCCSICMNLSSSTFGRFPVLSFPNFKLCLHFHDALAEQTISLLWIVSTFLHFCHIHIASRTCAHPAATGYTINLQVWYWCPPLSDQPCVMWNVEPNVPTASAKLVTSCHF